MYYFVIQLFKEEFLDDIMLALTTAGIDNGTVVDGVNMDNMMNQRIPLFAGLIPNSDQRSRYCKVISCIVEDKQRVKAFLQSLDDADIDFEKEGIGRIILIPAEEVIQGRE
ncbi:MAG TPA: hypothetical protein PLF44_03645 [Candidatus Mcinerneyibacteriales bacterium]|jgi:hypothetical protein|nr:hypothetical protein [Candidatus Mcinerneyibacteriota bacterium]HOO60705.1 hypothetical protein [Candidatus Mcinerneyibacteriales bacterium]HPE20736.1 hypothetical protein [Candidatus Mcinerneyibacteriales bacterium]HPJ69954.1 hypothetical protein [Candidatus Mcinerneyibacteriales bacterium]HPQ89605.1 hypothetical protein [Candidatus Mcinerneyibacteriales bacterium]